MTQKTTTKTINFAAARQIHHQPQTINEPTLKPITVDNPKIIPTTAMQHKPTIKPITIGKPTTNKIHQQQTTTHDNHQPIDFCSNCGEVANLVDFFQRSPAIKPLVRALTPTKKENALIERSGAMVKKNPSRSVVFTEERSCEREK